MDVKRLQRPVLLALAGFSITFLRLPAYLGYNRPLKIAALIIFSAGVLALVPLPRRRLTGRVFGFALLYVLVIAVEILRGAQIGVYSDLTSGAIEAATYVAVLVYAAMLIATSRGGREREQRIVAIVLAPAIYVAANAILHLEGAVSPATLSPGSASVAANTPAQLLGLIGIHALRVEFPLTDSINGFGIVAGATLASTVVLARRTQAKALRLICLGFASASVYCLLLGDNRGALLISASVIVLSFVSRRLRATRGIAVLLPLFPLLVLWGLGAVADSPLVGIFSREGNDLVTATNRLFIWEAAWNVLKHPSIHWLYGWGAGGQITSGATAGYAHLFGTLSAARVESTHNVVIQSMVDGGLIAVLALAAATYVAIASLSSAADEPACAGLLAALLVVILSGLTEDAPTYYTQDALLVVLMAFGAAAALGLVRQRNRSRQRYYGRRVPSLAEQIKHSNTYSPRGRGIDVPPEREHAGA